MISPSRKCYLQVSVLCILVLAAPALFARDAFADTPTRRVLILTGYDPNHPAITIINQTITTTMKHESPARVEFFYEFQENFRIPNSKFEAEMVNYLKRKYEGEHITLVLALGAPALEFLLDHESELFPGVPKVFYFHDETEATAKSLWPRVTGVWAQLEFNQTLDIALAAKPDTKNVVIVSGTSKQDRFLRDQAESVFGNYATRVSFTYLTDLTIDELKDKLSVLPPHTVVIYLSYFVDKNGNSFSGPEALSRFASTTNAPIFGISQTYLGAGMVGGSLLDFEALGKETAETGLRLMAGAKPADIPPSTAPNTIAFDWRQLQKWNIDESKLPPGSVVSFRQPTFWQVYRWYVIGASAIVLVQALLIVWLLLTRARRRSAELRAAEEHRRLNEVVSNVPGVVWESRLDPATGQRRTTFISQYVEKMLGYDVNDWFVCSGFGLSLVHEEDRDRVERESEEIFKSGTEAILEFRWIAKDGRVVWVAAHLAPIFNDDGNVVGLRGVTLDTTAQRMAEFARRESEERFRNMADSAPVMIWVSDQSMMCTYVNKQWLDFTGRKLEEELNNGWSHGIHADDFDPAFETFTKGFAEKKQFASEYRLRRHDGQYRWILDCGAPRFSASGAFLGFIGSCLDITERKQSEHQLRHAHEQLQELKNQLEAENIYLQSELQLDPAFREIIGQSSAIKYVLFSVAQVAQTDSTVLISGETGTGKELVARAIHYASLRKDRPLIRVNCGALAPTLIESELFGHEKGAFTGAGARKLGRFDLANGGTIFLDEIGELPLELQVKLLRVIQENEFERVGGTQTIKTDVRIIAATNRELKAEVAKGNFREDLWYRLNVYPITLPPLRQRMEDLPLLVEHFMKIYTSKFGKTVASISPRAMQRLQAHSWPGNIRELANAIERAVILTNGTVLQTIDHFELPENPSVTGLQTLEELERDHILRTLEQTGWRVEGPYGAAKALGLNASTLRTRMRKLSIQRGRV
jgi:PAS domain S-box-containing protein